MTHQFPQQGMHFFSMDGVIVIQHQDHLAWQFFQLIAQRGKQDILRGLLPRLEESQGFLTGMLKNSMNRRNQIA